MKRAFEDAWLSDDPLAELDDEELFGRAHLIERIVEVLGRVRQQSTSSTIGLVGTWGSGKTTVLDGIARRLREPDEATSSALGEKWCVAEFNPWMYAGPLELHVGFFRALRDALPDDAKWKNRKKSLLNFGKGVAPIAGLAGLVGVDGEGMLRRILDGAADSVSQERDKVSAALREAKQPVLVIVDDLDRLSADELLHVFKLVRLVGRLPYVYYVLSYDEHTIVDLLSKTDLVAADNDRRALDYLEKIVQVRLDMPLLRHHDVDHVVDRSIAHIAAQHKITVTSQQRQGLRSIFDEVLTERLRSPRALKRVFGQVDAFLGSIGEEVNFEDFFVLTWLRTMEPGVYALIQRHQKELLGTSAYSLRSVHTPEHDSDKHHKKWVKRLRRARVDDASIDDVFYLLQTLFPELTPIYRREDLSRRSNYGTREREHGRVHHPDYFDRYFSFGVPADDIADQTVRAAVADIAAGNLDSPSVAAVNAAIRTEPELVIRKVWHFADAAESDSERLVRWCFEQWAGLTRESMLSTRLEGLAASVLMRMNARAAGELARDVAVASVGGALFMATVTHAVDGSQYGPRDDTPRREAMMNSLLPALTPEYRNHLMAAATTVTSPLELEGQMRSVVLYWRLHSPLTVRAALQEVMEGQWDVLDTVAWLLPLTDGVGGEPRLSSFGDLSYITDSFDMGFVDSQVHDRLPATASLDSFYNVPATADVRRDAALHLIRLAQIADEERTT